MKIKRVLWNNRKKAFAIEAGKECFEFPYSQLKLRPCKDDPLVSVTRDAALGNEGFTYTLRSGATDTVHIDHVLRYAQDREYLREELLFNLTTMAKRLLGEQGISKRALCRRMKTSPAQVYRLLDTTFYGKTVDQMVNLLHALGHRVEFKVKKEAA